MYIFWTTKWTPRQETTLTHLDMLIDAARSGDLNAVSMYIKKDIHRQDEKGDALYEALKNGHTNCVIALKFAINISRNLKILPRHYYAAGMMGQEKPSTELTDSSDPLLHSINEKDFRAAHLLLKKGVSVEPIHFYAAGKLTASNPVAANDFYELLCVAKEGIIQRDAATIPQRR